MCVLKEINRFVKVRLKNFRDAVHFLEANNHPRAVSGFEKLRQLSFSAAF
jgi:hypothetical protein